MTTAVTRDALEARVTDALVEFGAEREDLLPEASLETLDIDSLDLVELAQILEEEYGVEIRQEDAEGITTYGDVIDMIYRKISEM